jgi:CRISPR system Cascade subunit CasA
MTLSFNLLDNPFIPCIRLDGKTVEYGLRDTLVKAHEIAELRDDSPLVTIALHRLLLGILHRCYRGPQTSAERLEIRKSGCFNADRIHAYLQKWVDRFDLFHAKYPFFQRAGFSTKEPSSINRLSQERSRGNNAALFDHTTDEPPPALTPAQAARAVIAEQAFAVGGGKSETGNTTHAPLVSGATVLIRGETLFETLWLNLTLYDGEEKPIASEAEDAPIWEQAPSEPHKEPVTPRGYLDYLTWQSRTLRLHPEEGNGCVIIRRVSYAQGRKFVPITIFYDPMMAFFRRDKKESFQPLRFNEFRDLWRDSAALFQLSEKHQEYNQAPATLLSLAAIEDREVLPRSARYRLSVFGLCTEKAKVNFWRHETLPLPLAYLDNIQLFESLKQALALAEAVASEALRPAAWVTASNWLSATPEMKPDTDRVRAVVDSFAPERLYWSRLERPFRELLLGLAEEGADLAACVNCWYWDTLHTTAKDAFNQSIGRIDAGRDFKAVNVGRGLLFTRLKKIRKDNSILAPEREGAA